jgi:ABC-2 type transport system ATP-binding protein
LAKLHTEIFVLNLRNALKTLPKVEGYAVTQVDETTLEVEVSKEQDINALFASLSKAGVQVLSMRNKANRLEELFIKLTERKEGTA